MAKITINEVAKHAGVSVTTVSRVLNNRGYISEETRSKVQESINALGFIPNEMARSLFTTYTRLIGLIIPSTINPYFGELAFYIEKYLSVRGYKLLICNSINEEENEKNYLRMLQENRVDGIIFGSHNINIHEYDKMPLKMVCIERSISDNIPVIQCDNYHGGELATEALIEAGCQNILCLRGDPHLYTPANHRYEAHQACMEAHGLVPHFINIPFTISNSEKYKIIQDIFQDKFSYDGVFAGDDMVASILYNCALENHIRVPEDLKIIGFDGTETMKTVFPTLATICQPVRQLAEASVTTLLDIVEDRPYSMMTTLPVSLYRGRSLGDN